MKERTYVEFMDFLEKITGSAVDVLYSYVLIILLVLGGLYFTVRSKGIQFRMIAEQVRVVGERPSEKGKVSSFQALMVSTASRVGTGNIIGVATAILLGGYGSVFWMWIIALIGAASAFVESTLAQIYKSRGIDGCYGGPAYYIETALKCRPLAIVFSIFLILTYGVGFNMLASYNLQSTFEIYSFYDANWTKWIIGGIFALLVGFCLFGGGKRIVKATSLMVPFMGIAYILVALVIVIINIPMLPSILGRIFSEAFDFHSIFGGFMGSCIMLGVKRGLFSNEAGIGSAPNASASADVAHPVKQGLVQVLSVFIDTILVCTATAFMCMCSGLDIAGFVGANGSAMAGPYVQEALKTTLGGFGPIFITVAMVLFAFTTMLGNLYYVDKALIHIAGKMPSKRVMYVYYVIASGLILLGAGLNAGLLWNIADIMMALMAIINMPVILYLSKYAFRALADYIKQKKEGKTPVFHAKDIDLPHEVDYWD